MTPSHTHLNFRFLYHILTTMTNSRRLQLLIASQKRHYCLCCIVKLPKHSCFWFCEIWCCLMPKSCFMCAYVHISPLKVWHWSLNSHIGSHFTNCYLVGGGLSWHFYLKFEKAFFTFSCSYFKQWLTCIWCKQNRFESMKSSQGFKPRLCHVSLSTLCMVWGRRGMNLEQEIKFAQLFQF